MVSTQARYALRILICLAATGQAVAAWEEASPLPMGPRSEFGVTALRGKIYVFGGRNSDGVALSVVQYDPARDSWERKADMPFQSQGMGVAALDGNIYLVGGLGGAGVVDTVYAYDPAADSWRQRASLSSPRFWLGCAAVGGKLYAIGGGGGGWPPMTVVDEYDPATDTWTRKSDAPRGLMASACAAVDARIYVFGGLVGGPNVAQSTALSYDPALDEWTRHEDMPTTRQNLAAVPLGEAVYAIGGSARLLGLFTVRAQVEKYDVTRNHWREVDALPFSTMRHGAAAVDGRIYVFGGSRGGDWGEPTDGVLMWDTGVRDVDGAGKLATTWGALRSWRPE